jgi:photosystem II stability/assembly factor-like uncharacterized protein
MGSWRARLHPANGGWWANVGSIVRRRIQLSERAVCERDDGWIVGRGGNIILRSGDRGKTWLEQKAAQAKLVRPVRR